MSKNHGVKTLGELADIENPVGLNPFELNIWRGLKIRLSNDIDIENYYAKKKYYIKPPSYPITIGDVKKIENPMELRYNHYRIWIDIKNESSFSMDEFKIKENLKVYYIYGNNVIENTLKAKEIIINNIKTCGTKINLLRHYHGNWHGTGDSAEIAVLNLNTRKINMQDFMLLIKHWPRRLNTKYEYKLNNYKLIIITSTQDLKDIYPKETDIEYRKQIYRRITNIINLNE